MKNAIKYFMYVLLCLFAAACSKQLPALEIGNVVEMQLNGFTVGDSLQLLNEGKVIATIGSTFAVTRLLSVPVGGTAIVEIRQKDSTRIIATRKVNASPFRQSSSLFFDNGKIYDQSLKLEIKGYATGDSLELLLDGTIIAKGIESNFTSYVNIGAEEGMQRVLQIRRKKDGTILSTRKIAGTPAVQKISFYYDGTEIIDKVNLTPPADPTYMNLTAKMQTTLPDFFTGMPVDLVFYKYDTKKGSDFGVKAGIILPLYANFDKTVSLPPLPPDFKYFCRICRTGTDVVPYDTTKDLLPIRNNGILSNIAFNPGTSQLWVIKDFKSRRPSGSTKGTVFTGFFTDLSQYFQ